MRDEMIDLVCLIVLTALLLSLGYVTVLSERKTTESYNAQLMEDKNVGLIDSLVIPVYGDFDGTLTKGDVILMPMVLDFYMPKPRTIKTEDGGSITIESTIEGSKVAYGTQMAQYLNASGGERFNLEYNNGEDLNDTEDDYFFIKKAR